MTIKSAGRQLVMDTLRAEIHGTDLQDDGDRIVVCAEREDGTLYELGDVKAEAVLQDSDGARQMIERIKWGRHPRQPPSEAASIPTSPGSDMTAPPTTQGPT